MMTQLILKAKRLWWLLPPLLAWGAYFVYENKTLGFSSSKIVSDFSYNPAWEIKEPPTADIIKILDQTFTFSAVGSQSYAFVSADGRYVLKFFRMKHLIPRISDFFHPEKIEDRRENLLSIFDAHKLAYDEMREDAGLIYIHLNKTSHLQKKIRVKDWLGFSHQIDLDQTEFVIQEKAELIFADLKNLLRQGDHQTADKRVAAMLELVQRQIDRGIADHDKAVKHNYGFVDGRPIHLDVGRIYKEKKPKDLERIAARINKWRRENSSS